MALIKQTRVSFVPGPSSEGRGTVAGGVTCGPSPGTGSLSLSLSLDMRVFIVSETSKSARYVLGRYSYEYLVLNAGVICLFG